jgi:hypothetical protein
MSKFKPKPFKKWLDALARLCCKTRDDWTCQHTDCGRVVSGKLCNAHHIKCRKHNYLRWDLINLLTLCATCHRVKFHDGPEGAVWFEKTYPARYNHILSKSPNIGTWREDDFLEVEEYLLQKCVDLDVDPFRMSEANSKRLIKKLGALR